LPAELHAGPNSRPRVWVHAVSAGEVVAAVPILREMRALLPDHDIVLSVITPAGHEMAEQQALPFLDGLFYFPIDLPWVARRVVEIIRPRVFVGLESDMWPNLLHELKRHDCRTVMVNGRISEHSFQRTRKIAGSLYRWMLSNMDRLLMQSALDAQRVRELGHLTEPGRVTVLGNSKFDQEIARLSPQQTLALRRSLRLPDEAPVFVAGSTRSAEEEAHVVAAYKTMRGQVPDLCLVIAPRDIDRAPELSEAMRVAGLSPLRRSEIKAEGEEKAEGRRQKAEENGFSSSLILDTMGELANVYAVASFAFVGNSFPPVTKGGGQNLLQPLAHGKAVLFGPYTATTRSEVALATEAGVGFQVADGAELAQKGLELLTNADLRTVIAAHAIDLIAANKGVSRRYAEMVAELTRENTPPFKAAPDMALGGGGRA
jgi:3-deoxy-D-manno-octulosonic-acid transferase